MRNKRKQIDLCGFWLRLEREMFVGDHPHRGEQHDQDSLRTDDGGRIAALSRVSPGETHFGLGRGAGAGIWALIAEREAHSGLTVGFTRAAAFALSLTWKNATHNQIAPRYNRREAASGASCVRPHPFLKPFGLP